jgi:hypothetical protein
MADIQQLFPQGVTALAALQKAQQSGFVIEHTAMTSRVNIGYASAQTPTGTGQIAPRTYRFFATAVGNSGQGFSRVLDPSDNPDWISSGQLPDKVAFVGTSIGVLLHPETPRPIKQVLGYRSTLRQTRQNQRYNYGPAWCWGPGPRGIVAPSVATGEPNTTIDYSINGLAPITTLPQEGWILLPPGQQLNFELEVFAPFFATSDGLTKDVSNEFIQEGTDTEFQGYLELMINGLKISTV